MKYSLEDWNRVKHALAQGMSSRDVAKATHVSRTTVLRWSHLKQRPDNLRYAMITIDPKKTFKARPSPKARLTYEDRVYIAAMRDVGATHKQIATRIGVARSTISRELARLGHEKPYDPSAAQIQAEDAARRPKPRKLDRCRRLRRYVISALAQKWSPRQISQRLIMDYPDDERMRVSHETIYQALYVQGRGALRQELAVECALRSGRTRRIPASKLPSKDRNKTWVAGCEISTRPPEVDDRAVPGHWEGDLIVGGDLKSCLVTLVERKTRFLAARRLETHDSKTVVDLLIEMCKRIPDDIRDGLCSTLTWDQGSEMAEAVRFSEATGFKVYFCDPHSPWQRGTNENTNGLIRQYFPKGTRFTKVTDEEVKIMQDQMNGRPRETFGWRTPAEALAEELAKAQGAMTA